MENLIIDSESLKQIKITATQEVHRRFAMAFKGTQQIAELVVFKKGQQISLSTKATEMRTANKATKAVCGLIQGNKKEKILTFMLPGTEEVLEKMGIEEKSYICSVNPYPNDNLRKNIKDSNADFDRAEFRIIDSVDDPVFSEATAGLNDSLKRWEDVKSDIDLASFYLIEKWKKTRKQADGFAKDQESAKVEEQWLEFEKAHEEYAAFVKEATALVVDVMDAANDQKKIFVEAIEAANIGDYNNAKQKLKDVV